MPRANQVTATNHPERFRGIYGNVPVNQLVLAPGCGMKYLPRESSDGKDGLAGSGGGGTAG